MNERDFAALGTMLHPGIRLKSLLARVSGSFTGMEGIRLYFEELDESFEGARWDLVDVVAHRGDVSVLRVRFRATGRGSGVGIDEVHPQVWRLRDGLGYENEVHVTVEDALASAGIAT